MASFTALGASVVPVCRSSPRAASCFAAASPRCAALPPRRAEQRVASRAASFAAAGPLRCAVRPQRPAARRATCPRRRSAVAAAGDGGEKPKETEPERDEDGLYIGTYSNFFTDASQIRGVIIFCGVLASFFSLGNIGAALLLPILYDRPIQWCVEAIVFGYPCK